MSTLLTVPFVTSTASVPPKAPRGDGEEKFPEMWKVVMISAFATPVISVSARTIRVRAERSLVELTALIDKRLRERCK